MLFIWNSVFHSNSFCTETLLARYRRSLQLKPMEEFSNSAQPQLACIPSKKAEKVNGPKHKQNEREKERERECAFDHVRVWHHHFSKYFVLNHMNYLGFWFNVLVIIFFSCLDACAKAVRPKILYPETTKWHLIWPHYDFKTTHELLNVSLPHASRIRKDIYSTRVWTKLVTYMSFFAIWKQKSASK